ncbi:TetR/AcrR family transcriptional regulator [Adhaeribacter radiodurans]|uniref:TetR/AcrR family transcriptional regulator n=1 Tax=Adhaeribacter radiodurans TaxID=2745197 RepID=A0A7L7L8M1_9BACT|nr:TetR/AcrR family transcriptional regulator [Adhaeribacter radiodurans]QMU29182.1 TetR/AcrR family transcriptional regulator [Adhaeribacter radiodurans]
MSLVNRKEQIEQTATRLFKTQGFAATSMRTLAQSLGMEAASIYAHIRSKEEILQKVCFRLANDFFTGFQNAVSQPGTSTDQLQAAIVEHVRVITTNLEAATVFQTEWRHLSEPYLGQIIKLQTEYEAKFRDLLKTGKAKGEFKFNDVHLTTRVLLASLNGIAQWYNPDGILTPTEIATNFNSIFLHGIVKGKISN